MSTQEEAKSEPRFPNRRLLSDEEKERYVEGILNGLNPAEAAEGLGTTGSNVRRFRNPSSPHYDEGFAEKIKVALASTEHRTAQLERLRAEFFKRAMEGSDRLMEKLLMIHDPEYRLHNGTQRVSLEADVRSWAERALPSLPQEQLDAMILTLEARVKELPPGDDG